MAEYYGVTRTPEYLMHYGVKGMRWGVRKAIARGNTKHLDRQYRKAYKKLQKLNKRADINTQKAIAEKYDKASSGSRIVGRVGLGLATTGIGSGALIRRVINPGIRKKLHAQKEANLNEYNLRLKDHFNTNYKDFKNPDEAIRADRAKIEVRLANENNRAEQNAHDKYVKSAKAERIADYARNIGIGMAIGGYGYGAYSKIRANKARNRASIEGHKEAVVQRNAWQREMNKAFAGTKYANGKNLGNAGKTKQYVIDLRSKKRRAKAGATGKRITTRYV